MARLTVWQPFGSVLMDTAMDNMMRNAYVPRTREGRQTLPIVCDVTESEAGYMVQAVLPGMHPDQLTIDFVDDVLTIKAEVRPVKADEGVRYHVRERTGGWYERSFRFPLPINGESISASYDDGILTISLPKAEAARPRRIEVQTAV